MVVLWSSSHGGPSWSRPRSEDGGTSLRCGHVDADFQAVPLILLAD